MKTVLGLLVNTAIAFLLLILIAFVSRGSICFLTVNPTSPIAAPSLFLDAEVVNRILWPISRAFTSRSSAWWTNRCSWMQKICRLKVLICFLSSSRDESELSERQLKVPLVWGIFGRERPFLVLRSKDVRPVGFRTFLSLEAIERSTGICRDRVSRALAVDLFSELVMVSNRSNTVMTCQDSHRHSTPLKGAVFPKHWPQSGSSARQTSTENWDISLSVFTSQYLHHSCFPNGSLHNPALMATGCYVYALPKGNPGFGLPFGKA